jgi:hypothetical protein
MDEPEAETSEERRPVEAEQVVEGIEEEIGDRVLAGVGQRELSGARRGRRTPERTRR